MNKRMKIKNNILHKKCDGMCATHRAIAVLLLTTNNGCERCKFKKKSDTMCENNRYFRDLEISKQNGLKIINSSDGLSKYEPIGLFWFKDGESFIALDNFDGECWTEEFTSLKQCKEWLLA